MHANGNKNDARTDQQMRFYRYCAAAFSRALVALSLLSFASNSQADIEIFVGLDTDPDYASAASPPDENNDSILRALSWSTGGSRPVIPGQNQSFANATLQAVTVALNSGAKAGQLIAAAASGTAFGKVYIRTYNVDNGSSPQPIQTIELTGAFVSSVSFSDSADSEVRSELVTFEPSCLKLTVFLYTDSGAEAGTRVFEWDRSQNQVDCSLN